MANLITINNTQIEQLTYHDHPVVTFEMIARVHGVPFQNVHKAFSRHQDHFVEGKHYYRIPAEETLTILKVQSGNHGALLFTEKGYLLLVKPMRDAKSWQVQDRMVDDYFALRQALQIATPPVTLPSAHDRLDVLKACAAALEALGVFDDRDRADFGAYVRQVARAEMQPLLGPGQDVTLEPPRLWTMSMRMQHLGYPPFRGAEGDSLQIKIGMAIKKAYTQRYGEPPKKMWDYVKGQQREVNAYPTERIDVLEETLTTFLGAPRPLTLVPQVEVRS